MPWRQITVEEVNQEFTPQEAATLKNIQGAQDNLPNVLGRVVEQARGAIRAGSYPLADDASALPSQLVTTVIDLAVWRYLKSFPTLKALQTKDRKDAYDAAMTRLKDVANQKENIEPPDADTNTSAQPRPGQWNSENKILGRSHPAPTPATQFPSGNANRPYANPEGTEDQ
jgi:hypothetical protein